MAMHFLNTTTSRGPEISLLSCTGGKFHLDLLNFHTMFHGISETPFMAIMLWNSILQHQNGSLHIVRNNGNLKSKDPAGIPLDNV